VLFLYVQAYVDEGWESIFTEEPKTLDMLRAL
jgi:hypothetical protein